MEDTVRFIDHIKSQEVTLVAVSKTKPVEAIQRIYDLGVRDFGENRVQEMVEKEAVMPRDIRWHQIGHLQKNKVKYIAPFVHLIHSVDSLSLLKTIQKEALKNERILNILLQIKIATEETKFGLTQEECIVIVDLINQGEFPNIHLQGLMGMASFTSEEDEVKAEFASLKSFQLELISQFPQLESNLEKLSMGMSGDYNIAIEEGSNMVRVGSKIFGTR